MSGFIKSNSSVTLFLNRSNLIDPDSPFLKEQLKVPEIEIIDDNHSDALAILELAQSDLL